MILRIDLKGLHTLADKKFIISEMALPSWLLCQSHGF